MNFHSCLHFTNIDKDTVYQNKSAPGMPGRPYLSGNYFIQCHSLKVGNLQVCIHTFQVIGN